MAAEAAPSLRARIFGAERLRAGWRIAIWVVLFLALMFFGGLITTAAPGQSRWGGVLLPLAAAVAAGVLMLHGVDRRPGAALGFALEPAAVRESAGGTLMGVVMLGGAVAMLWFTGAAFWTPDAGTASGYVLTIADGLLFFAVAAAAEEAIFRGYPFQVLVEGIGVWPAVLLASGLFAVVHAWNPNVNLLALANIALAGIWLSLCYLRTRSLWFATGAHLGWNWAMASVLDFPVSGLGFDTPLYDAREAGADWWTGGSFGPEAGLAATVSLLLGTAWLLRSRAVRPSQAVQAHRPLVDARLGPGWG